MGNEKQASVKTDWAKKDREEGQRYIDAFIETVNADHMDVIPVSRDIGCLMRNEIERLRKAERVAPKTDTPYLEACGGHCGACDEKHRDWEAKIANLESTLAAERASLAEARADLARGLNVEFQRTNCAVCGVYKHTPVRNDDLGGYVCGGCLEKAYVDACESAEAERASRLQADTEQFNAGRQSGLNTAMSEIRQTATWNSGTQDRLFARIRAFLSKPSVSPEQEKP